MDASGQDRRKISNNLLGGGNISTDQHRLGTDRIQMQYLKLTGSEAGTETAMSTFFWHFNNSLAVTTHRILMQLAPSFMKD